MTGLFSEYKYRVMAVYIAGLFIQIIDATVVNIAVPALADEFGVDSIDIDWVIIGFYLAVVVIIPVAGYLGDRFGTKRIFLIALSGFVGASVLCGVAQTLNQLIVFRMFQGLFAGLITPIGSAMLFRAFPLHERARASAAVIGVAVVAPAVGPTLGGVLVETLSWRWIFYINVPIGALGLALGFRWLREEIVGATGRIDWAGLLLAGGGLGLVLYAMSEGPNRGWGSGLVLAALMSGTAALVALVVVETRIEDPALALRLFRNRLFRAANLTSVPVYMGFFSQLFLLPIFLQKVGEHSAITTGLAVSAQAVGIIITSQLAGRRLYATVGPRRLLIYGSLAAMIVGLWFVSIDETTALWSVALATFVRGLTMGIIFIPIQTATYATIALPDMGRATSLFNTQRQAAIATGVAVVASILSASVSSLDSPADGGALTADRVAAFQTAFLASALVFGVAALLARGVRDEDALDTMRIS